MKRIQTERAASQRADKPRRKSPARFGLMLCLVLLSGTAISTAVLGGSLSRYTRETSHVIALAPEEEQPGTAEKGGLGFNEEGAKRSESPKAPSTAAPRRAAEGNGSAAQTEEYQGELLIYDAEKSWSTETQVDLFRQSYNESGSETVRSEDGSKVIAPGTSNFYPFTLENNGSLPLDYTVSLKVEDYGTGTGSVTDVPLEWRLLAGDGAALSDWRGYTETAEVMKRATLDVRRQDSFTIEWHWAYERGEGMDQADTEMGDRAVMQPLGAKATITVYAEQKTPTIPDQTPAPGGTPGGGQNRPGFLSAWPKTGDASNLTLYIVLLTISGGGLLILFGGRRLRKRKE